MKPFSASQVKSIDCIERSEVGAPEPRDARQRGRHAFDEEELKSIGATWAWPLRIEPLLDDCNQRLKAERNRAEDELNNKQEKFIEELDEYQEQLYEDDVEKKVCGW